MPHHVQCKNKSAGGRKTSNLSPKKKSKWKKNTTSLWIWILAAGTSPLEISIPCEVALWHTSSTSNLCPGVYIQPCDLWNNHPAIVFSDELQEIHVPIGLWTSKAIRWCSWKTPLAASLEPTKVTSMKDYMSWVLKPEHSWQKISLANKHLCLSCKQDSHMTIKEHNDITSRSIPSSLFSSNESNRLFMPLDQHLVFLTHLIVQMCRR